MSASLQCPFELAEDNPLLARNLSPQSGQHCVAHTPVEPGTNLARAARWGNARGCRPGVTLRIYSDYKSPYAYLAKDLAYDLERETGARLDWLPYTLDIPAYLGSAKLDASGKVLEESRNAHQWRRVKYSYLDCRREANLRGLTIRGPKKIFDSSLANIGMLYAKRHGVFRDYHDRVFERFWKRELDIESPAALAAVLSDAAPIP